MTTSPRTRKRRQGRLAIKRLLAASININTLLALLRVVGQGKQDDVADKLREQFNEKHADETIRNCQLEAVNTYVRAKNCPHCDNIGQYWGMHDEVVQCQFCWEDPDSRFNYVRKLTGDL